MRNDRDFSFYLSFRYYIDKFGLFAVEVKSFINKDGITNPFPILLDPDTGIYFSKTQITEQSSWDTVNHKLNIIIDRAKRRAEIVAEYLKQKPEDGEMKIY